MSLRYCHPSESVELFQKNYTTLLQKPLKSNHQQKLRLCKLLVGSKMPTLAQTSSHLAEQQQQQPQRDEGDRRQVSQG